MDERDWLEERFGAHRGHLRAVAYRMLGSRAEADDAVQEARLRLTGAETSGADNLRAWLTTVVGRASVDMLCLRSSRRESSPRAQVADPIVRSPSAVDPEQEVLLGDSVGLALLVVLDTLTPAERIAFVLHEILAVPFDEIATIVNRSPTAARQLVSRARRRIRGAPSGGHTPTAYRV